MPRNTDDYIEYIHENLDLELGDIEAEIQRGNYAYDYFATLSLFHMPEEVFPDIEEGQVIAPEAQEALEAILEMNGGGLLNCKLKIEQYENNELYVPTSNNCFFKCIARIIELQENKKFTDEEFKLKVKELANQAKSKGWVKKGVVSSRVGMKVLKELEIEKTATLTYKTTNGYWQLSSSIKSNGLQYFIALVSFNYKGYTKYKGLGHWVLFKNPKKYPKLDDIPIKITEETLAHDEQRRTFMYHPKLPIDRVGVYDFEAYPDEDNCQCRNCQFWIQAQKEIQFDDNPNMPLDEFKMKLIALYSECVVKDKNGKEVTKISHVLKKKYESGEYDEEIRDLLNTWLHKYHAIKDLPHKKLYFFEEYAAGCTVLDFSKPFHGEIVKKEIPTPKGKKILEVDHDWEIYTGKDCLEKMLDYFVKAFDNKGPIQIFAHNAGKFDMLFFLKSNSNNIKFINKIKSGGRITALELEYYHPDPDNLDNIIPTSFILKDSLSFIEGSLGRICYFYKPKYAKMHCDIAKITKKDWQEKIGEWYEYLVYDVLSLSEVMHIQEGMYRKALCESMTTSLTKSSIASNLIKKSCITDYMLTFTSPVIDNNIRSATYGGRIFHNQLHYVASEWKKGDKALYDDRLISLDYNALYPSAMYVGSYPKGKGEIFGYDIKHEEHDSTVLGIYHNELNSLTFKYRGIFEIDIKLPKWYQGMIPYKIKEEDKFEKYYMNDDEKIEVLMKKVFKKGQIQNTKPTLSGNIFPTNCTVNGWWTDIDIQEAVRHGAKVVKVYHGIVWKRHVKIFADMIKWLTDQRFKAKYVNKNAILELVYKVIANSEYGKMIEESLREAISYVAKSGEIKSGKLCNNGQVEYTYAESGDIKIPCHYGVFILSFARKLMNDVIDKLEYFDKPGIVYGDTDSMYVPRYCQQYIKPHLGIELCKMKNDYGDNKFIQEMIVLGYKKYAIEKMDITKKDEDPEKISYSFKYNGLAFRDYAESLGEAVITDSFEFKGKPEFNKMMMQKYKDLIDDVLHHEGDLSSPVIDKPNEPVRKCWNIDQQLFVKTNSGVLLKTYNKQFFIEYTRRSFITEKESYPLGMNPEEKFDRCVDLVPVEWTYEVTRLKPGCKADFKNKDIWETVRLLLPKDYSQADILDEKGQIKEYKSTIPPSEWNRIYPPNFPTPNNVTFLMNINDTTFDSVNFVTKKDKNAKFLCYTEKVKIENIFRLCKYNNTGIKISKKHIEESEENIKKLKEREKEREKEEENKRKSKRKNKMTKDNDEDGFDSQFVKDIENEAIKDKIEKLSKKTKFQLQTCVFMGKGNNMVTKSVDKDGKVDKYFSKDDIIKNYVKVCLTGEQFLQNHLTTVQCKEFMRNFKQFLQKEITHKKNL